jgi:hypothetical protein
MTWQVPLFKISAGRLQQFKPVPERVCRKYTRESGDWHIVLYNETGLLQKRDDWGQTVNDQSRMGFQRGPEIRLHTQMQLKCSALEPHAPSGSQICRLRQFLQSENIAKELPGRRLSRNWHR